MERNYNAKFILLIVAGAIEEYDLFNLIASLQPQKLFIANPLSAKGLIDDYENAAKNMNFSIKVYSEKNVPNNFILIIQTDEKKVYEELLLWLR